MILQQLKGCNEETIDSSISRDRIARMLESAADRMNIDVENASMEMAVDVLMEEGIANGDRPYGNMSTGSFRAICLATPKQEEIKEIEIEENEQVYDHPRSSWKEFFWFVIWMCLYGAATLALFVYGATSTYRKETTANVFGVAVALARASALCVNLNAALVLLPVSRHLVTWMQSRRRLRKIFAFDASIFVHRVFGGAVAGFGVFHSICHCFTYTNFVRASSGDLYILFGFEAAQIPSTSEERAWFILKHRASITGIGMLLCMVASFAVLGSRRKNFNKFWYFHHLLVLILILLCLHGTGSFIAPSQSYIWLCIPMIVYLGPRIYRECGRRSSTILESDTSGNVLSLTVEKPKGWDRSQKAGMYAMINIPAISRFEWHPFTISSAPHEKDLTFYISCTGDWTRHAQLLLFGCRQITGSNANIPVRLEGPFGAPSQGTRAFEVVVLIGAGIGVTPMMSTLCSLLHRPGKMKKVFLYWAVRDSSSFRLFNNVLDGLYEQDNDNRLEIRQFLTSAKTPDTNDLSSMVFQHAANQLHAKTDLDVRLGHRTRQPMRIGRPKWKHELKYIMSSAETLGARKSGVFFCGPEKMGNEIESICNSLSKRDKVRLFHQRNFLAYHLSRTSSF